MRNGDADSRLPHRQASSGLPRAPMEPGFGYAAGPPQQYRSEQPPPQHASSSSHDHSSSRGNGSYGHRAWSPDRTNGEPSRHPHPHAHPDRSYYDHYQQPSNDPRARGPYLEQHSPRDLGHPLHAAPYTDAQRRQLPYQDHFNHPHQAAHPYRDRPYPEHAVTYRDSRAEDLSRASARRTLPSPRDGHRPPDRMPPTSDYSNREAYPIDQQQGHARYPPNSSTHDARHWPETRRYSDGPSQPAASAPSGPAFASSTAAGKSSLPSRKRKKQFKYMLENEDTDSTKPTNADAKDDEQNGNSIDTNDAADGADNAPQRKESRKKVKKACVFCKRSHMPCEEARPCKRCVKRGISHLCRDAEPSGAAGTASTSKSKFEETRQNARAKQRKGSQDARAVAEQGGGAENESGSDSESLASSSAASSFHRRSYDMNIMPGAATRDPDFRPTMPVSMLCSPANAELARRPPKRTPSPGVSEEEQKEAWNRSMDPSTQHKMKTMLEAGNAAGDLSDVFGEIPTSLLMTPAQANLPRGQAILRPSSVELTDSPHRSGRDQRLRRSLSMTLDNSSPHEVDEAGFKLPRRPKHLLQEELATTSELRGDPRPYSYTYGYAKLARWMHTRFSRESCEAVDRALGVIRPKLMTLSRSLPESELIGVEDSFYQLLEFYTANVLETIPIPMILARRTGEIYAANSHACALMQLPASIFEGGQICHYQLVAEKDAVNMWGKYAKEARGELDSAPSQKVMLEVDRSLLLFEKPGFDPCTGELLGDGSGRCEDGSPAVIRKKVIVTFEAKISKHGLPFMVTGFIVPIPDDD